MNPRNITLTVLGAAVTLGIGIVALDTVADAAPRRSESWTVNSVPQTVTVEPLPNGGCRFQTCREVLGDNGAKLASCEYGEWTSKENIAACTTLTTAAGRTWLSRQKFDMDAGAQ